MNTIFIMWWLKVIVTDLSLELVVKEDENYTQTKQVKRTPFGNKQVGGNLIPFSVVKTS